MQVKAHAKFVRISPKKVRLVANLIAGMKPANALLQLQVTNKRSTKVIETLLKSAMANAKNNFNVNPDNMVISQILVNQGPTMRRYRPRAMGRASIIRKRTSHVSLELSDNMISKNESEAGKESGAEKTVDLKQTKTVKKSSTKNANTNEPKA